MTLFQRKGRTLTNAEIGISLHDIRVGMAGKTSPGDVRSAIKVAIDAEQIRMETLRDDAIRALTLMVQVGALTREQINAAINGKKVKR